MSEEELYIRTAYKVANPDKADEADNADLNTLKEHIRDEYVCLKMINNKYHQDTGKWLNDFVSVEDREKLCCDYWFRMRSIETEVKE